MKRWSVKTLGELVSLEYGKPLKSEERSETGRYPVYGSNGIVGSHDQAVTTEPTVVVGRKGAIGEAHLALSGCWPIDTAFYTKLRQPGGVSLKYLLNWFRNVDLKSLAITATIPGLNRDTLYAQRLPVPPLAEQERIVKLLDEADALRKLRAQADRRTASLLPALFDELFGQHLTTPPVLVSTDGATAPKGWRWARLTEVARLATGHTPSRRKPEYWTGGTTPWITLTDIRKLDGTVAETTSEFVTEAGLENSSAVKLPKGTVCFSRTASVGFVTVMGREMCTSQDFVNWVCGPELDPIYLMAALVQSRDHLRALASGSTHKTIYFPTVEQFSIPVPPLPLQQTFARRVAEIRELEAAQAASRRRLDALFASLLHRAFAGEL